MDGEDVIKVFANLGMADFIGSIGDVPDVIGHFIDIEVVVLNHFILIETGAEKLIKATPIGLAKEENRHLWHLSLLHQDENLGKLIERAETAREKDIDLSAHGKHDLAGEKVFKL